MGYANVSQRDGLNVKFITVGYNWESRDRYILNTPFKLPLNSTLIPTSEVIFVRYYPDTTQNICESWQTLSNKTSCSFHNIISIYTLII